MLEVIASSMHQRLTSTRRLVAGSWCERSRLLARRQRLLRPIQISETSREVVQRRGEEAIEAGIGGHALAEQGDILLDGRNCLLRLTEIEQTTRKGVQRHG